MRYIKQICLFFILAFTATSYGQAGLSVLDSFTVFSNDTIVSSTTLYYGTHIKNTTNSVFNGTITYITAIDTSLTGGSVPANLDTINNSQNAVVNLNPNDSIPYNDSIDLIINFNSRGGINTVVIWPVASDLSNFPTVDSTKFDVVVLDPLLALRSMAQKSTIVLSPSPFFDKIHLISGVKTSVEQVRIIDMRGLVVYENKPLNGAYIETAQLLPGVYFVEVSFANGTKTIIKTIKQ